MLGQALGVGVVVRPAQGLGALLGGVDAGLAGGGLALGGALGLLAIDPIAEGADGAQLGVHLEVAAVGGASQLQLLGDPAVDHAGDEGGRGVHQGAAAAAAGHLGDVAGAIDVDGHRLAGIGGEVGQAGDVDDDVGLPADRRQPGLAETEIGLPDVPVGHHHAGLEEGAQGPLPLLVFGLVDPPSADPETIAEGLHRRGLLEEGPRALPGAGLPVAAHQQRDPPDRRDPVQEHHQQHLAEEAGDAGQEEVLALEGLADAEGPVSDTQRIEAEEGPAVAVRVAPVGAAVLAVAHQAASRGSVTGQLMSRARRRRPGSGSTAQGSPTAPSIIASASLLP